MPPAGVEGERKPPPSLWVYILQGCPELESDTALSRCCSYILDYKGEKKRVLKKVPVQRGSWYSARECLENVNTDGHCGYDDTTSIRFIHMRTAES